MGEDVNLEWENCEGLLASKESDSENGKLEFMVLTVKIVYDCRFS